MVRGRSGSHYTPRILTEPIVRKALEPVLRRLGFQPDSPASADRLKTYPTPQQILDLKICDDEEILVLATTSTQTEIISVALGADAQQTIRHTFGDSTDQFVKSGLQARRMEVNGRKGRRTLAILDEQGRGYGVFDLDSTDAVAGGDEDAMEM